VPAVTVADFLPGNRFNAGKAGKSTFESDQRLDRYVDSALGQAAADLLAAIRFSQHGAILQMQVQRMGSFAANDSLRLAEPRTERNQNRTLSGGFHESTSA
jgi:hypothetical protein